MTSISSDRADHRAIDAPVDLAPMAGSGRDLEDYGTARVRDVAFDAVRALWRVRQKAGLSQRDIATTLGRDPGWVSRQLRGPGNWTFRTFGALVEALGGEVEIVVYPLEQPVRDPERPDAPRQRVELANALGRGIGNAPKRQATVLAKSLNRPWTRADLGSPFRAEKRRAANSRQGQHHG